MFSIPTTTVAVWAARRQVPWSAGFSNNAEHKLCSPACMSPTYPPADSWRAWASGRTAISLRCRTQRARTFRPGATGWTGPNNLLNPRTATNRARRRRAFIPVRTCPACTPSGGHTAPMSILRHHRGACPCLGRGTCPLPRSELVPSGACPAGSGAGLSGIWSQFSNRMVAAINWAKKLRRRAVWLLGP